MVVSSKIMVIKMAMEKRRKFEDVEDTSAGCGARLEVEIERNGKSVGSSDFGPKD